MVKKVTLLLLGLTALVASSVWAEDAVIARKAAQSLVLGIEALSDNRLVAVGERGHVLVSEDQGKSWKQVPSPTQATLTAVTFVNDKVGYAVGHEQVIIKTTDGGNSWQLQYHQEQDLDYPALLDVWFHDENHGVATGAYGLYLMTEDGGKTWEFVPLDDLEDPEFGLPHFYSFDFDKKNKRLYMAGEIGSIAVSEDLGKSWKALPSPYEGSFFRVKVTEAGTVHAMGLRGNLFRSADGGQTWKEIDTGSTASINDVVNVTATKLVYVCSDGVILVSNNDGLSVVKHQRKDRSALSSAVKVDDFKVVLGGEKGLFNADDNGLSNP
ncbi:YCF48-related protein [Pleionea sp. CnH1-48]|uniref:WD40/YVTN/BNR-like repeat-containing protein n=1 Tax=Pleionea sp. CnH1-48 TaxID=2954494 RepID=UPI00209865A3|nr:YCF48-related protein [Pleionea sp. CnH1-48]MCO7222985.1 YCF48-related protein [Pleionea sp. CnH1-48]